MNIVKKYQSLEEVEQVLLSYAPNRMYAVNYELTRVRGLLDLVGNPQNTLKVVHVTGTSGKTSTSYYVRALLESTGVKVGLTVSPHIKTICERLQISRGPIAEDLFVTYFNEFYSYVKDFEPRPTYFELLTVFVYWVFAKEKVDYAVIEVGLGGRYDATNVVVRQDKVCVINTIGYDHTEILGTTLTQIAEEKAGIIQEENEVFTVVQDLEASVVIEAEVQKKHASLHVVTPSTSKENHAPPFLQSNFALALAAVQYVVVRDSLVLPAYAENMLERVAIPGRFEVYTVKDRTILLDGAHNPQKLRALLQVASDKGMKPAVVVAAFSDAPEHKIRDCAQIVQSFANEVIYTTFVAQRDVLRRSVSLVELQSVDENISRKFIENAVEALQEALKSPCEHVIVTGSLYLVSILRPYVQQMAQEI